MLLKSFGYKSSISIKHLKMKKIRSFAIESVFTRYNMDDSLKFHIQQPSDEPTMLDLNRRNKLRQKVLFSFGMTVVLFPSAREPYDFESSPAAACSFPIEQLGWEMGRLKLALEQVKRMAGSYSSSTMAGSMETSQFKLTLTYHFRHKFLLDSGNGPTKKRAAD